MDMMTIGKGGMLEGQYRAEVFLCVVARLRSAGALIVFDLCERRYAVLATPLFLSAPDITKFANGKNTLNVNFICFIGGCARGAASSLVNPQALGNGPSSQILKLLR